MVQRTRTHAVMCRQVKTALSVGAVASLDSALLSPPAIYLPDIVVHQQQTISSQSELLFQRLRNTPVR